MWKWEDSQVVISSSNFHLETSSLSSPYIHTCHHGCIFGLRNTNKSHQQLHSTQMPSNPVCQSGKKSNCQMMRMQKSPKYPQGTRLKAFLLTSYSKPVRLISAIITFGVPQWVTTHLQTESREQDKHKGFVHLLSINEKKVFTSF